MYLDNVVLRSRATDPIIYARQGGPGDVSLDKGELVGIFIEALIYGVEALTFIATVYLLHGAKHNKFLFVKFSTVIIIFLLNTIHIGTSLRRILNAFVGTPVDPLPDAAGYLADLAGFLYRFKNILIVIQTIMLDILVAYRCYMVWDRKLWIALLPSPSIVAYLGTGIAAIHAFAIYRTDTIFTGATKTWVSATLCITLLTKLMCLTIIVLGTILPRPKSLWQTCYVTANQHAKLYKAVLIGIESGGLAALGALILVPVYLSGRNAQSILWSAMSPLTGESFLLIVTASLLGLTPSTAGASRRRKGTIPNNRVTIPPISVSPIDSPSSRFSAPVSFFNFSSASPTSPSEQKKPELAFPESVTAHPNSRFTRGDPESEPLPFSTAIASIENHSKEANVHDSLTYGVDRVASRKGRDGPYLQQNSSEGGPRSAFYVARSADGSVEVLQKEQVAR